MRAMVLALVQLGMALAALGQGGVAAAAVPTMIELREALGLPNAPRRTFDGIGGLSGGGATSTFLQSYPPTQRGAVLDALFKPGAGASLSVLKIEIASDDQTTDGCEAGHWRRQHEPVNCTRGCASTPPFRYPYEWALMKQAKLRNSAIKFYGLPWTWAGWLGFNTTDSYGKPSPYTNVTASAEYITAWATCARDSHGLNISYLGLWNEAEWVPDYILALRSALDKAGHTGTKIVAADGDIGSAAAVFTANDTVAAALAGGVLGSHYPGASGTTALERGLLEPGKPDQSFALWASEDFSTYSDTTGAGCWSRLLVQNAGWGLGATISWYLVGSFARGMRYDSDGFVKATWPTSGHWELTPMAYATAHWTLFAQPGWGLVPCPVYNSSVTNCMLPGGGNYAALTSPESQQTNVRDFTMVLETLTHGASMCFRKDPSGDWPVATNQTASFSMAVLKGHTALAVWRSCVAWNSTTDGWLQPQPDLSINSTDGSFSISVDRDCVYTITTTRGQTRPTDSSAQAPESTAFKLPFSTTFDGPLDGGEGYYLGDQMGKWEAADSDDIEHGIVMRQVVTDDNFAISGEAIVDRLNGNVPLSIIGDLFMEDLTVATEFMIERKHEHTAMGKESFAGVALRVNAAGWPFRGATDSPMIPGLFLRVYASGHWSLCAEANCTRECVDAPCHPGLSGVTRRVDDRNDKGASSLAPLSPLVDFVIKSGQTQGLILQKWHKLSLTVLGTSASATFDGLPLFQSLDVLGDRGLEPSNHNARAGAGWAALTSSFSGVLFDNLALTGAHMNRSSSVRPCNASTGIRSGMQVGSFPCDAPGAVNGWRIDASTGLVHVNGATNTGRDMLDNKSLCLVAELAPPPSGGTCQDFANVTGNCGGLTHTPIGDHSKAACAAACCEDPSCGTWQFLDAKDNPSPAGNCWIGACAKLMNDTSCNNHTAVCPWATGWRKQQPSSAIKEQGRVMLGSCGGSDAATTDENGGTGAVRKTLLRFDPHTGRILAFSSSLLNTLPHGNGTNTLCVGIRPKKGASTGAAPATAVLQACQPLPCDFQQFQVNQPSGILRHKAGFCVEPCTGPSAYNGICEGGASVKLQGWPAFRDCCLSMCG